MTTHAWPPRPAPGPNRPTPNGVLEREQRRATTVGGPPRKPRRTAIAVDGKCLRGAKRPERNQVFVTLHGIP